MHSIIMACVLLLGGLPAAAQSHAPPAGPDCAALGRATSIDLADTPENSTALYRCGYDRYDASEPAAAGRVFQAAIAMAARRGDAVAQSNALRAIAKGLDTISLVRQARGNYSAALAAVSESLELRREFALVHPIAESLNNTAVIYEAQGDYAQAARLGRLHPRWRPPVA